MHREDVWNFAPNLVHVKPYHFFQHTGDINAPPGLAKQVSYVMRSDLNLKKKFYLLFDLLVRIKTSCKLSKYRKNWENYKIPFISKKTVPLSLILFRIEIKWSLEFFYLGEWREGRDWLQQIRTQEKGELITPNIALFWFG